MTQEIRNAFSSRETSAEIVDVVTGTYHLLLDASRDFRHDQIAEAKRCANDNPTKDVVPALRLFESVRGSRGERLFTSRLVARLASDETQSALGLPEKEINQLRSLFSELRGCCLILEQHRHIWAHENTEESFIAALLREACVARLFRLAADIAAILSPESDLTAQASKYGNELFSELLALLRATEEPTKRAKERKKSVLTTKESRDLSTAANGAKILTELETIIDGLGSTVQQMGERLTNQVSELAIQVAAKSRMSGQAPTRPEAPAHLHVPPPPRKTAGTDTRSIDPATAMRGLLDLRDRIYSAMTAEIPGFQPYHNVLQRPIAEAVLEAHCSDLQTLRTLPEFKKRMGRNPTHYSERQLERFGQEIDAFLSRIAFPTDDAGAGSFDFDDDIPF